MQGRITLKDSIFTEKESTLCTFEGMSVSVFRYSTGVCAVRIRNDLGYIIVLPFQGQQIWDAVFYDRPLKMQNYFDEPILSEKLLDSYGAFLFHCGALRMGTPGPEDSHPLHGELPGAVYNEAFLIFGADIQGSYLGITGQYNYTKAFGDKYQALPEVKIYKGSSLLKISMTIDNKASRPMDLMYMCHVNFLPAENGEIFQAAEWNTQDMVIRSTIPSHVKPSSSYLNFLNTLKNDPGATRILRAEDQYNPEVVFYLPNLKGDQNGNTHLIQRHSDGSSDYISYNIKNLNHAVRWILKNDDQKVIGMLPATCDPEGYTAENKKGNVRSIPAGGKAEFEVLAGYLKPDESEKTIKVIENL